MVLYEFREKEGSPWGAAVLVCLSSLGRQDTWSPLVESRRSFPFSSLKNVVSQTQILRHASIMKSRFPWELKERFATIPVRAGNGPLLPYRCGDYCHPLNFLGALALVDESRIAIHLAIQVSVSGMLLSSDIAVWSQCNSPTSGCELPTSGARGRERKQF